jgi:hypothetical protein
MTQAFDGNAATKWFAGNGVKTGWLAYQFAGNATHVVTSYAVTSANDVPGRDPSAWTLEGSNDGDGATWIEVDARTGQTFARRHETLGFTCTSPASFARYRLNISANSGGNELQLAEVQLFGN